MGVSRKDKVNSGVSPSFSIFIKIAAMNFLVILTVSCMIVAATAKSHDSALEMKVEALNARLANLETRNNQLEERLAETDSTRARMSELEEKNNELEKRMAEVDPTREIFDCYLTDIWKTNGIITFDGCSVDMTNGDPRGGLFVVVEPGVYRLTFTGHTYYPSSRWASVYMKVDGEVVAAAEHDVGDGLAFHVTSTLVINTLQQLEVGQTVTVEWDGVDGAFLDDASNRKFTHFTGQLLGSVAPLP